MKEDVLTPMLDLGESHATWDDVDLVQIARQNGTPVYIYNFDVFRKAVDLYRAHLPTNTMIKFAAKANSNIDLLRFCRRLELGADVVSVGELRRCLDAGIPSSQMAYAGVGKTLDELTFALQRNIGLICVESEYEVEQLSTLASHYCEGTKFLIRVNFDIDANTHPYLTTGKEENKFGIHYTIVSQKIAKWNRMLDNRVSGIQVHIGSQVSDLKLFSAAIAQAGAFIDGHSTVKKFSTVDFGGGLAVDYEESQISQIADYCRLISDFAQRFDGTVVIEPGRSLCAACGVLVGTVLQHKEGITKDFLITDIGMNDFIRPALYEAFHNIRSIHEGQRERCVKPVDIVGPICESGDFIATSRAMNKLHPGDIIIVEFAGAYGYVMSSNYNLRPRPAEVVIDSGRVFLSTSRS